MLNRIFSLSKMGIKLGLGNMSSAMQILDLDLSKIRIIHIAGTNGKGSTSAMLQKLIQDHARNKKVGLYTSPHLVKYNERIKINDQYISDEKIVENAKYIFEKCASIPLTFFEFTTLLAFLYFIKNKIDFAVIETGLGGRFDATNIINPEICIITSIAMDHTEYLGNDLEKIAFEKAGIFKHGAVAILSKTPCNNILRQEALKSGIKKIYEFSTDFNPDGLKTSLLGKHQYKNAACAVMAFKVLNLDGTAQSINKSLQNVSWRGRLEKINIDGKTVYLDVSHNPEGIYSTVKFLLEYHKNEAIQVVCGFMKDKDYSAMIKILYGVADKMFLMPTIVEGRQISFEDYKEVINKEWNNVYICKDYKDAVDKVMKEEGVVLFTGSLFNFEHISRLLGVLN